MIGRLPYTVLRDAVFTHPTMAEGLGPLFGGVPSHAQTSAKPVQSFEIDEPCLDIDPKVLAAAIVATLSGSPQWDSLRVSER